MAIQATKSAHSVKKLDQILEPANGYHLKHARKRC